MYDWCYMDIYSGYSHLVHVNIDQEMSSLLTYGRPVSAVINLQLQLNPSDNSRYVQQICNSILWIILNILFFMLGEIIDLC